MKGFDAKKIRLGCITGFVMLSLSIYSAVMKVDCGSLPGPLVVVIITWILMMISNGRWNTRFETKFRTSGFLEKRFPHYLSNQPELNTIMFNTYKWLIITIISAVMFVISIIRT